MTTNDSSGFLFADALFDGLPEVGVLEGSGDPLLVVDLLRDLAAAGVASFRYGKVDLEPGNETSV